MSQFFDYPVEIQKQRDNTEHFLSQYASVEHAFVNGIIKDFLGADKDVQDLVECFEIPHQVLEKLQEMDEVYEYSKHRLRSLRSFRMNTPLAKRKYFDSLCIEQLKNVL